MGGVAYKMVKKAHYECDLGPGGRGDSLKMKQSRLSFLKTTPKIRGGSHDNISEEGGSFDENMTSVGPVNDVQRAGIKMKDCEERIRP